MRHRPVLVFDGLVKVGRLGRDAGGTETDAADTHTAIHRLATYGSLAPGRLNDHELGALEGRWVEGHVYGRLVDAGWGASLGFPALILDPTGLAIPVHVFESVELPAQWSRLDDFEGPGYQRVVTTVHTAAGEVDAWIYVLRAQNQGGS